MTAGASCPAWMVISGKRVETGHRQSRSPRRRDEETAGSHKLFLRCAACDCTCESRGYVRKQAIWRNAQSQVRLAFEFSRYTGPRKVT
jgi:hypothetical protein